MKVIFPGNVSTWLAHPLAQDVAKAICRLASTDGVARVAVMPDVHLGQSVCIGTVVATESTLLPDAVGGDIGCGMAALAFNAGADLLADEARAMRLLAALRDAVPGNRHRGPRDARSLPSPLNIENLSAPELITIARRDGVVQVGTLGRGNHFLEFQRDEQAQLWLMIHSGSRAIGQSVRACHSRGARRTPTGLLSIDAYSDEGRAYLRDVEFARAYAAANRRAMADATVRVVQKLFGIAAIEGSFFDCDHNHVRQEAHFGRTLWVHRKGATSAGDGEPGIIPGSMATESFHVIGRGEESALRSSSHGGGRSLPRGQAARQISPRELCKQMRGVWFDQRLAARLLGEAPSAYKDIGAIMRAQRDLTRISKRLTPLLSYKCA